MHMKKDNILLECLQNSEKTEIFFFILNIIRAQLREILETLGTIIAVMYRSLMGPLMQSNLVMLGNV